MSDVARISPAEAHARMRDEAFTYVDVRTEEEFEAGHPEGAVNVPFVLVDAGGGAAQNPDFVAVMEKAFAKDAPLIVGCKVGERSARAAKVLSDAGFSRVLDQSAGWDGIKGHFGELLTPGWSRVSLPSGKGRPEGRAYADLRAKA